MSKNTGVNRRLKANEAYLKYLDLVTRNLRLGRIGLKEQRGVNLSLSLACKPREAERFLRYLKDLHSCTYSFSLNSDGSRQYRVSSSLGVIDISVDNPGECL